MDFLFFFLKQKGGTPNGIGPLNSVYLMMMMAVVVGIAEGMHTAHT